MSNDIFTIEPLRGEALVVGQELLVDDVIPSRFNIILLRQSTVSHDIAMVSGDGALAMRAKKIKMLKVVWVGEISRFAKGIKLDFPSLDPVLYRQICEALECSDAADPYREDGGNDR